MPKGSLNKTLDKSILLCNNTGMFPNEHRQVASFKPVTEGQNGATCVTVSHVPGNMILELCIICLEKIDG